MVEWGENKFLKQIGKMNKKMQTMILFQQRAAPTHPPTPHAYRAYTQYFSDQYSCDYDLESSELIA